MTTLLKKKHPFSPIKILLFLMIPLSFLLNSCTLTLLSSVNMTTELITLQEKANKEKNTAGTMPIDLNKRTFQFIHMYLTGSKKYLSSVVERSYYFVPMMQKVFREENLPEELIYLPVIESGFVLSAISSKRASGPWQFMAYTGKIFGLNSDWWHDERMDPEKSTRAAARFLKDLYHTYGDWYLALAAYNCGPGRVSWAIKKAGTRDFWQLCDPKKKYLPKETQYYVPKFLAAATVIKNMNELGFEKISVCNPLLYDNVTVPDSTDLELIAKCAGTDYETIKSLNPELKQWATPPEQTNFIVKIPLSKAGLFYSKFSSIPPEQRVTYRRYQIQPKDTISGISQRYKVPQDIIMSFNKINNATLIRINDYIIIPIRGIPSASTNGTQAVATNGITTTKLGG